MAFCKECGKEVIQTNKYRIKVFCSHSCRATHLNRNRKLSEETRDKIRIKQLSPERRELYLKFGRFIDKSCKKCGNIFKQDITDFNKEFCSASCRQSWINSNRNINKSEEAKKQRSNRAKKCAVKRAQHPDRIAKKLLLPLIELIRCLDQYKEWRTSVYQRDDYTCTECNDNKGNNLHAHHKKQFGVLFKEFLELYNQFSPIDDKDILIRLAIDYEPFWDINNGATLCVKCHCYTRGRHKYGNTIPCRN